MKQIHFLYWFLILVVLGCTKDLTTEFPNVGVDGQSVSEFRMISYNIHGGKGPNGEGSFQSNLTSFSDLLMGESVMCMQEVEPGCWNVLKSIFPEYPYRFYLPQRSTKFGTAKDGGNAIFSKLPIVDFDYTLVNTDPGGDKWERKAQYVKLYIGADATYAHLFHYHNTYNWHNNNSEGEKQGFERFVNWVMSKEVPSNEMLIIIGDFNLSKSQCDEILDGMFPFGTSNWVDHIYGSSPLIDYGIYNTVGESLSDHQAVWAVVCNDDC